MGKISLKAARMISGLTQDELANRMNVHRATISAWESNPSAMKIKDAEEICAILNININDIFFGK